jgi:phosphatidylserine/phosphatidylglycerophosphate/cardiolipin synthase-like enzyme/membrane protein DedA with SNARE-associated domain
VSILQQGRNCWRIARASRAAVLVDGAAYFSAFREAAAHAHRSIVLIGWDIDSRTELAPQGADDGLPNRLSEFLDTLVARRRDLHAYVLGWDFAMLYALEREMLPIYSFGWRTHRHLHYHLDDRHPPGGSHHQKIAVVDGRLAFVGGIDFAATRWDTPEHALEEPARRTSEGAPYSPFHDVTMMVEGDAARALHELACERWRRATGKAPAHAGTSDASPWPAGVAPEFEDVDVGIARTEPAYGDAPAIDEVKHLYLDSIAEARRSVYVENQYFTSKAVSDALEGRVQVKEAPEFVLVSRKACDGWLEQETMEALRARRFRRLREVDTARRFHAYYPDRQGLGEDCIRLHSKLMIVDQRLLRIGSANLANRSMGYDTECDLALEAGNAEHERAIAGVRARLLAEHLASSPEEVARRIDDAGSLVAAIEALRGGVRTLVAFPDAEPQATLLPDPEFLDPERPIDAERLAQEFLPPEHRPRAARRIVVVTALLLAATALTAAWRWGPLGEWLDIDTLRTLGAAVERSMLAPLYVLASYVAASLVAMPITLLILATTLVFGPLTGVAYALAGSLAGAAVTFWIGRALGRGTVRRLAGKRLNALSRLLARRGVLAVLTVRILPVAPFTVVNLVAGAAQVRPRDFLLGTAFGMAPGIVAVSLFSGRLSAIVMEPSAANLAWLALALAVIAGAGFMLYRWLGRSAHLGRNL